MHVSHGRVTGKPSEQRTATFTGTVHMDPVLDAGKVVINTVIFTPGARTYWHSHPGGQLPSSPRDGASSPAARVTCTSSGSATSSGPSRRRNTGTVPAATR